MNQYHDTTFTAETAKYAEMLREQGLPIALGAGTVLAKIPLILEDAENGLPGHLRQALALVYDEVRALERRVKDIDRQRTRIAAAHPVAQRLLAIPGIGVITATALLATVAHIHAFRRARHFASWIGLTPSERSSGFRRHLGRISKRGDVYLRCLLTHAGRAVLLTAQRTLRATGQGTRLQHWAAAAGKSCFFASSIAATKAAGDRCE